MFTISAVIHPDDEPYPMYPVPTGERDGIEMEPRDGSQVLTFIANEVEVSYFDNSKLEYLMYYRKIKAQVRVTDSRVAVACSKYDKGGGWWGDPISMAVANTGSLALAAMRRHKKMLTAQIRYPWLSSVGFLDKSGFSSQHLLRLVTKTQTDEGDKIGLHLDLTLSGGISAEQAAVDIVSRCAQYRLAHDKSFLDGEREGFRALLAPERLVQEKNTYSTYRFPTFFDAVASTAGVDEVVENECDVETTGAEEINASHDEHGRGAHETPETPAPSPEPAPAPAVGGESVPAIRRDSTPVVPQPSAPTRVNVGASYCTHCGNGLAPASKFCGQCGSRVIRR